jgi:RimK family alpha-L-glutamate ligase
MRFALIARRATPTNDALAGARAGSIVWELMTPEEALENLQPGDVAVGRLDVLPSSDGIDDGLWSLGALAARGVTVLNDAAALLAVHDKLQTARLLRRFGLPHPTTVHVREDWPFPAVRPPVVVKPRFGSNGRGVYLCEDETSLSATVEALRGTSWFGEHGVLVQTLVPPHGYDLRILVAGERVVGSVFRVAAPGEWRTNVALGAVRKAVPDPPPRACTFALAAAQASRATLVGVDLLRDAQGNWTIVELNGAVEFSAEYNIDADVFAEVATELARFAAHAGSLSAATV